MTCFSLVNALLLFLSQSYGKSAACAWNRSRECEFRLCEFREARQGRSRDWRSVPSSLCRFLFSACRLIVDGAMGAVVAGSSVCLCLASIFSTPCAGGNDPPADEGEAHETVTAQMSTRYWSLNARLLWCVPLCRERLRNKQYEPRGRQKVSLKLRAAKWAFKYLLARLCWC